MVEESNKNKTEHTLKKKGYLKGHGGWVTSLAVGEEEVDGEKVEFLLSGSRDKTLIKWKLDDKNTDEDDREWGKPTKMFTGHSHFIQEICLTGDGRFCFSASWDGTVRLWNVATGRTVNRLIGHTKDVLSVAFSADNRQIVSGSRDKTIKLWNTLGQCKYTITEDGHKEWVSCVRFSPNLAVPVIVSAGWDKLVKVWNLSHCKLRTNLIGHTGYVNIVTVSPDGSLCASGGKDGTAMLWDLNEGRHLSSLDAGDIIHALVFSPVRYWLCAATASTIKIWDLESKVCVDELKPEFPEMSKKAVPIHCISLAWSADGGTLFAGYTDNIIRVWAVS